jgi:hypothetical protein
MRLCLSLPISVLAFAASAALAAQAPAPSAVPPAAPAAVLPKPPAAGLDQSFQAITLRLAEARISMEAQEMPPDQVLDLIRKAGSVNIVVTPEVRAAWADRTVTLRLDSVSALSAFHHLLRHLDVCSFYADEAMVVTTPKAIEPAPRVTVYDIRGLVEAPRSFRTPPTVFGSQIDPLYYYFRHTDPVSSFAGARSLREFMDDLEYLERYPPDPYGEIIADVISKQIGAKERGVSVTYRDGYLIVAEQPPPARLSPGEGNIKDTLTPPKP